MALRTRDHPGDLASPLRDPSDLDPLIARAADARVVCIGEASHGTHEFYAWRAELTKRLIEEVGFDMVAVEGDWPDCHAVHRSVTGEIGAPDDPRDALLAFERWPTWMWANEEVVDFTRWLRDLNAGRPVEYRVGFHGLDVYSLWESLDAVLDYLRQHHPEHINSALDAFRCFEPYAEDPQAYARATTFVPQGCEVEVVSLLSKMLEARDGRDAHTFVAEQNARAVQGAEAYYRAMVGGGPDSWNIRDTHMADTLDRLLGHRDYAVDGSARAVVWEHNTHIGDARFTDMADAGKVNVGQLVRERYGEESCLLVGFGTYHGSVIAADAWARPMHAMPVPPAREGSSEALLHATVDDGALFVFPEDLPDWAATEAAHRAIGVVYRSTAERWGNYVPTVLGRRYDAFLWLDETHALKPLHDGGPAHGELETWPSSE